MNKFCRTNILVLSFLAPIKTLIRIDNNKTRHVKKKDKNRYNLTSILSYLINKIISIVILYLNSNQKPKQV